MNTLDLAGRRIAVTGGLGGLGLATAAALARVIAFLRSADAQPVTGACLLVGGRA